MMAKKRESHSKRNSLDAMRDKVAHTVERECKEWLHALYSYDDLRIDVDDLREWSRPYNPSLDLEPDVNVIMALPSEERRAALARYDEHMEDMLNRTEPFAYERATDAVLHKYPNLASIRPPGIGEDDVRGFLEDAIRRDWLYAGKDAVFGAILHAVGPTLSLHGALWRIGWSRRVKRRPVLIEQLFPAPQPMPDASAYNYAILVTFPAQVTRQELDTAFAEARDTFMERYAEQITERTINPGPRLDYRRMAELYQEWAAAGCPEQLGRITGNNRYDKERLKKAIGWLSPDADFSWNDFLSTDISYKQ